VPSAPFQGSFAELPREVLDELRLSRSAVRMDDGLVVFNWIDPPARMPEHSHPFDQLALILSGRCRLTVEGAEHELAGGDFLYIPASQVHALETIGEEPVLNVDVFAPAREDYLHLAGGQPGQP
jgi:mannose-6-phosphate isomerase-like protein (cupin superfamily)